MKENILSFVRTLFVAVGVFFIGKSVSGTEITTDLWELLGGAALTVAGFIWGILDKSLIEEKREAALKSLLVSVGAILVHFGWLRSEDLATVAGVIGVIASYLWSLQNKSKALKVKRGEINPLKMAGARPKDLN